MFDVYCVTTDDARAEMNHLNVGPGLLSEIFKRFKENGVNFTTPLS